MIFTERQKQDHQALNLMATQVSTSCPDLRQMARDTAKALLTQQGFTALDPDQVYFHRFHTASSSPRTFNGWQHHEKPYQSLTLPQLVMHRFDAAEQDNADLLGNYTGFYTSGPAAQAYDERNEVPLAPKAVLEAFWKIDFSSAFHQRLDAFWAQHADDYRTLAKSMFLSKVLQACAHDAHSSLAKRARQIAEALTGVRTWPASLQELRQQVVPSTEVRLCTFDIGGHVASDILRVVMSDGCQLLYLPGEDEALQLFASDRELHAWVLANTRETQGKVRFMGHFPLASQKENDPNVGLGHLLDVMRRQWDAAHPDGLNTQDTTLHVDAFSHLRDAARQRMFEDAHFALRSNADLRKQLWIGYLGAFSKVFGPMAALDWPVALAAVGAGLAETGLDIDQALNGHTTAERQAGVTGAILAGINTLFNATFLVAAGVNATGELAPIEEAGEQVTLPEERQPPGEELDPATPDEIQAWVPEDFRPSDLAQRMQTLESNDILRNAPANAPFKGILVQDGKQYAMVGDLVYQVRFVGELDTWVIIDPENPYAFSGSIPIAPDTEGRWQPIDSIGLKGGGIPRFLLKAWGRLRPRPALPPLAPTPYDVAEIERPALAPATRGGLRLALEDPDSGHPYSVYRQLRDRLAADAQGFFSSFHAPARPTIPELPSTATNKEIIRTLYQESDGLVIGESHTQRGAKQFLIKNMRQLKKQGVDVLYMEHFTTDFHQVDLDLFNRTGMLSAELKAYVEDFDAQATLAESTPHTMKNVLYEAHRQNVRVQAIDCLASYVQAWDVQPSSTIRQEMMNYFAHVVIEADQTRRGTGKWITLAGNSHANTFMGTPGLSELEGVIGLRVEDVEIDQAGGIGNDPGFWEEVEGEPLFVKNDLLLQVPLLRPWM
ncbi:membrane-targeted effector domain-containing toxin [Pseudomonas sp. S 311-6]|uniref:membrane-targeted effector domain-containing toxin n=1 Tax=Pseudomonas TaxID=286 RepID=UPI002096DDC6|nr:MULTISPECIES: membrane-targeted effector domain-containing toxin [Pseudomonas]MCO7566233.1 membrane-targeted effector domain-containing toxin [Pseudomonas mosselii]MCO7618100.1 membrane-targeted effector domain-containing toxin [Pseudomonas guariconensis]MCO7638071.1 membrane-targeted effector domain-containing toxin [Pseudomonas sp. S 311-6]